MRVEFCATCPLVLLDLCELASTTSFIITLSNATVAIRVNSSSTFSPIEAQEEVEEVEVEQEEEEKETEVERRVEKRERGKRRRWRRRRRRRRWRRWRRRKRINYNEAIMRKITSCTTACSPVREEVNQYSALYFSANSEACFSLSSYM